MAALPAAGTRVALRHDVDRYPHFLAPAGATGVVADIGDPDIFAVLLDETLLGVEDWDNMILWSLRDGDDPLRDLAVDPAALGIDTTQAGWLDEYERAVGRERAYDVASADVVLTLSRADAVAIADVFADYLASIDEGEHDNYDNLVRVHELVIRQTGTEAS